MKNGNSVDDDDERERSSKGGNFLVFQDLENLGILIFEDDEYFLIKFVYIFINQ
jgi:hypothetical protein